ncbi:unnamed protein product [[Candida] boidinii]|uniref:Unnamed protein product n=1 Tax=Candida boidinii TaxID=5477 RepID=A0A9W6WGC1_CANBO|nr:hypothetical protein B5S33_g978 [[Candida] boidinii]GME68143.1 unnamed protein product [[Candida] boidinii]
MNVPITYIFLSEFDKFEGTTVKHQYPYNRDNCPLITDQLPNINLNLMPSQLQKFLNQENWTLIPIYCNNNYGVKLSLSDDDFDLKSSKTDSPNRNSISNSNSNQNNKRQSLNNSQYEPAYILTISYFKEDKSYRNGTALSLSIVTKLKFINCFKPLLTYLLHLYFIDQDFNNSISILKQLNKLPLLELQKNFENINEFNRYFITRIYQFENNKFDNNKSTKTITASNNFKDFLLKDEAKTNQFLYGSKLSKEFSKFDEIKKYYNESNNNFKINLKLSNGLPLPFTIPLNSLLTSKFFQFGYDLDNSNLLRNFLLLLNSFNLKFTSIKSNSSNSNNHHSFNSGFSSSRTPDSIEEQSPVLPYGANDTSILLILLNCMILKKKIIVHGYDTCINDVNDVIISLLILFKNSNLTQDDDELLNEKNLKENSNSCKNSDDYDWFKHFYPYVDLPLIDIIEELPYFIFGTSNLLFKTKKNKSGESYMWDIYLDLDSKEVHLNLDTLFTKKISGGSGSGSGKLNSPNVNSNGSTSGTGFMGSSFYYNRRNSSHSTFSSNSNMTSSNGNNNNALNNGNNHSNSLTNSSTNANSINDANKKFNIKNIFRKRRSISSLNSNQRSHHTSDHHGGQINSFNDDTSSIITSNTGLGYSYDDDQDEIEYANEVTNNRPNTNATKNTAVDKTGNYVSNAANASTVNNISKLERTSYTSVDSDDFDFLIDNKLLVNETRGGNSSSRTNNTDSTLNNNNNNNNNNGNNNDSDTEIETFPSFANRSINEYHRFTSASKYSNHRSFDGGFNFNYQQFPVLGEMKSHVNYNHLQKTLSHNTTSSSSFDIFGNSKRNSNSVTSMVTVPISRMDRILMDSIDLFINENHDDYIIYITITNYLWDLKNIIFSTFNNLQTFRILKDYTNYASHKLQVMQKDINSNINSSINIDNELLTDELEKFVKKEKIIQPLPLGISFEAYKNSSISNSNISGNNTLSHSHSHSHHAQTHRTRLSVSSNGNGNNNDSFSNVNNNIAKRSNRSGPIVSQFSNLLGSKIMIDYYDSLLESNKFGNFGMFKEFLKENTRLNSSSMQPSVLLKIQPRNISLLGFKDFCYFLDLNYLIHCCNILAMENNGNSTIGGIKFQDDDTHQVIAFNPYDVLIKKRYIYQIFRLLNDLIGTDKNNLIAFIIYCTRFNSGVFNMAGSENSENETSRAISGSKTKPSSSSIGRKLSEGSHSASGDTKYCIENISKTSGLNLTTLENIILIAMYFISEEDLDGLNNNNGDLSNNGIKDSNNSNGRNSRNSYNARNSGNGGIRSSLSSLNNNGSGGNNSNGSGVNNVNSNKFDNGSMLFEFKRFLNNFFNLQIDNNDRSYVSEWVLDNCNDFVKFGIQDFINYHY